MRLPFLQQGSVKVIAVPTFYEGGLTDKAFQVRGWVGCAAPAGTPGAIVQKLSDLMVEGGKTERVLKITDQFGIDEGARDRLYFKKVLDEERPVVLEVIKSLNIEPQQRSLYDYRNRSHAGGWRTPDGKDRHCKRVRAAGRKK